MSRRFSAESFFKKELEKEKLYFFKVEWGDISPAFNQKNMLKLKMDKKALQVFQTQYQMWISATLEDDGVLGMAFASNLSDRKSCESIWKAWLGRINTIRRRLLHEIQKSHPEIKRLPVGCL
jgi:hypothetical protein